MKVRKSLGCSWMEVDKKVHVFAGGDNEAHPDLPMILKTLENLAGKLKEAGYQADGSFALHDLDDEDKALSMGYHIAFYRITWLEWKNTLLPLLDPSSPSCVNWHGPARMTAYADGLRMASLALEVAKLDGDMMESAVRLLASRVASLPIWCSTVLRHTRNNKP
ncbi:Pentatricopeptide repeat-containing protein [Drosera capensis]